MALSLQRYTTPHKVDSFTQLLKRRIQKEKEKSMLIALEKIDYYLPKNLIIEILSRLPVKDLLQFKSVCKSWYDIISSPIFVSKHLSNYYNNNDDWRGCLFVQFFVSPAELQLSELLVDETPRVLDFEVLFNMPIFSSYVYGPCDGLYYVYQPDFSLRALWNPAINELKTLPRIIWKPNFAAKCTYAKNEFYGFGFDYVSRDYKVVVIKGYCYDNFDSDLEHRASVFVYSLKTNSWRYCGDLNKAYYLERNRSYIYVNGCCHWLGSLEDSSEVIIFFDMTNDSFKEIYVPDYAQPSSRCLAAYDDSLAFISLTETDKILDIWTWSEEGCWTKKFTAGPLPHVWSPVGHWKDNKLILQHEDGMLLLHDPDTQETNDLEFKNLMWCQGVYSYMESLVSIKEQQHHKEN